MARLIKEHEFKAAQIRKGVLEEVQAKNASGETVVIINAAAPPSLLRAGQELMARINPIPEPAR